MPWFRVDDKLHDHRKSRAAGMAAMGLWVLAGSWAADNVSDGFVPESVCARWDRGFRKHAASLVAASLWDAGELDGEAGWWFHDWKEKQPSRDDVLAKRTEARERMARVRANKADRSREQAANVRANTERSSQNVRSTPVPVPVPVPTTTEPKGSVGRANGARLPLDWEPNQTLIDAMRREGIPDDLARRELLKFRDHWKAEAGAKGRKLDWDAAWRNWLRKAVEYQTPANGRASPAGSTADQRVAEGMALAQRLRAQELTA